MARSRNIKPGFFTNEQLAQCDPWARLLFVGLWCIADRDGRLEDRPLRIKAQIFPLDPVDVDDKLKQLADNSLIIRYKVNSLSYVCIPTFDRHQNVHKLEPPSNIPIYPEKTRQAQIKKVSRARAPLTSSLIPSSLNPSLLNPESSTSPNGDVCTETSEARSLPEPAVEDSVLLVFPTDGEPNSWSLLQSHVDRWSGLFPSLDILAACRAALSWVESNPTKRKTASGMKKFLSGWITRDQNGGRGGKSNGSRLDGLGDDIYAKVELPK